MENQEIDETNHEIDRILDISLAERKDSYTEKYCWVCFANEEENVDDLEWVAPCRCKGKFI